MFNIEIHSSEVTEFSGTSQRTGNQFTIRRQVVHIQLDGPYPVPMELQLDSDQAPYPPGNYRLTPKFFIGRYNDLQLSLRDSKIEPRGEKTRAA